MNVLVSQLGGLVRARLAASTAVPESVSVIERTADAWLAWMTPLAWQVVLLGLIVALIERITGRLRWTQVSAALWWLVMAKLVLPPSLASPLSVTQRLSETEALSADATAGSLWLFWTWLAGVGVLQVGGAFYRRRSLRRLKELPLRDAPRSLVRLLDECATCLRVRAPKLELRTGAAPCTLGVWRTRIVLPADLADDLEQARHVLLHELAHVARRDAIKSWLCWQLQTLFWFHPAVWVARARLAHLREVASDRLALACLPRGKRDYSSTLLHFAERALGKAPAYHLGLTGPVARLRNRLDYIDRYRPSARRLERTAATATLVVMTTCVLPMANDRVERELIERPDGCLQLRYTVIGRLAEAGAPTPSYPQSDSAK